jgi:LacI family transcriptional regulator
VDKRKRIVALALEDSRPEFHGSGPSIVDGVIRWAEREDWRLIDLRSWLWKIPCATSVDGLIYSLDFRGREDLASLVRSIRCNVRIHPPEEAAPARGVATDWKAVGRQAADYYLDRGFRNFALAAYRTREWKLSLRVFKERVEQAGGQCQAIHGMHLDGGELGTVRDAVRKQLRDLHTPLGIFCANDRLAVRLYRWCFEEGIAVPEQAAILGYGNDTIACRTNPVALSSINPHPEQYGLEAARLLQRLMDGEPVAEDSVILVPPRGIVTRRSTDIMAIPDSRVARALRYIWDHYMANIGRDDVASACGISSRSLDRHFMRALGRTVAREITRQRLGRACELLVGGDMHAADIAASVGFRTPQYFSFQFKKHFGRTPQRYRESERKKRRRLQPGPDGRSAFPGNHT